MAAEYRLVHDPMAKERPWTLWFAWPSNTFGNLGTYKTREEAVAYIKERRENELEAERRRNARQTFYYDNEGNLIES